MNLKFSFRTDPEDESNALESAYKDRLYEKYSSERDNLNKTALEIGGRYDKAIFVLGGGALGLSITFVEKIAPHPTVFGIIFLVLAWALLLTSLVLLLFATSNSQNAIQQQIVILDATYAALFADKGELSQDTQIPGNHFLSKIKRQDWWCLRSLVAGLGCLCIFAVVNVPLIKDASATTQLPADVSSTTSQRKGADGQASSRRNLSTTDELAAPAPTNNLESTVQSQVNGSSLMTNKLIQPEK